MITLWFLDCSQYALEDLHSERAWLWEQNLTQRHVMPSICDSPSELAFGGGKLCQLRRKLKFFPVVTDLLVCSEFTRSGRTRPGTRIRANGQRLPRKRLFQG